MCVRVHAGSLYLCVTMCLLHMYTGERVLCLAPTASIGHGFLWKWYDTPWQNGFAAPTQPRLPTDLVARGNTVHGTHSSAPTIWLTLHTGFSHTARHTGSTQLPQPLHACVKVYNDIQLAATHVEHQYEPTASLWPARLATSIITNTNYVVGTPCRFHDASRGLCPALIQHVIDTQVRNTPHSLMHP